MNIYIFQAYILNVKRVAHGILHLLNKELYVNKNEKKKTIKVVIYFNFALGLFQV
jgi:hypothetical protein